MTSQTGVGRREFIASVVSMSILPDRPKFRGPQILPEYPRNLCNELERYGWWAEDAMKAMDAFASEGSWGGRLPIPVEHWQRKARAAAQSVAWMDDGRHDYSGEMYDCVMAWVRGTGCLSLSTILPAFRRTT